MSQKRGVEERLQALAQLSLPKPEELPNIDLYMDQVLSLVNGYLGSVDGNDGAGITKAMINNYSKAELIPRPERKRYNPEHIMSILMAHHLKQTLSLDDAKLLLSRMQPVGGKPQNVQPGGIRDAYIRYCNALEQALEQSSHIRLQLQQNPDDRELVMHLALTAAAQAQAGKLLCESLLAALEENLGKAVSQNHKKG